MQGRTVILWGWYEHEAEMRITSAPKCTKSPIKTLADMVG